MAVLIAATVIALAPTVGMDHPSTPVFNDGWSEGVSTLVNGKSRVHGYFVNWTDVFFFHGDTQTFNTFLADYAKIPGGKHRLILHTGKLKVMAPWDKKPRDLKANWRLTTNAIKVVDPTFPQPEKEVLELWLDDKTWEKKLKIPVGIDLHRQKS